MRLILLVAAASLLPPPAARAEAVNPTVEGIEGAPSDSGLAERRGYDHGASASTGRIVALGTNVSAQQGFEAGEGAAIPTTAGMLRLQVIDPAKVRQAAPPPDPEPERRKWLAVAVMLAGAAGLVGELIKRSLSGRAAVIAPAREASSVKGDPTTAGQFAIVKKLGEGGMGVVYEALDRTLDRRVAIKRMKDEIKNSGPLLEEFLREAKTVAALHHPNIVDIHSIVSQSGELYLVFEHVEGETLSELLARRGRFTVDETKYLLKPVCDALEFAHARRVVHRDLKPANVMLTKDRLIKVMDFGIARKLGEPGGPEVAPGIGADSAKTNMARGTLSYMAPEAFYGSLSPRSDVYALGVMLYEFLVGRPPYQASHDPNPKLEKRYERLSALSLGTPALSALVESALEPHPDRRTPGAAEFRAALLAG